MLNDQTVAPAVGHRLVTPVTIFTSKRTHGNVIRAGEFRCQFQVRQECRRTQKRNIGIPWNFGVTKLGTAMLEQVDGSHGGAGTDCHRTRIQGGDDLAVNLAIDHTHSGVLHDGPLIALAGKDIEIGLTNQVMPFGQRSGVLGQVVGSGLDQAIDASALCFRTA